MSLLVLNHNVFIFCFSILVSGIEIREENEKVEGEFATTVNFEQVDLSTSDDSLPINEVPENGEPVDFEEGDLSTSAEPINEVPKNGESVDFEEGDLSTSDSSLLESVANNQLDSSVVAVLNMKKQHDNEKGFFLKPFWIGRSVDFFCEL